MPVIWKFPLNFVADGIAMMPRGATILSAGEQDHNIVVWALCDPSQPTEPRKVWLTPTGATEDPRNQFIDTVQMPTGSVFHVFATR